MKSNLHLWMAVKRSALFRATEKAGARALLAPKNLPTLSPNGTHPLPFTISPPGTAFLPLRPVAILVLCCVAKSTCWESVHRPSMGFFFFFQSDPRAPPQPLHMTEIRQRGGGTDANLHSCETKVVVLR